MGFITLVVAGPFYLINMLRYGQWIVDRAAENPLVQSPASLISTGLAVSLRDGWLDGKGAAPAVASLDWIAAAFEERYPDDLRLPYLFPTPSGQLMAEWSLASWSLSLEIDPPAKRGSWHGLNLTTDEEIERNLDLSDGGEWNWLADQVRSAGGVAE